MTAPVMRRRDLLRWSAAVLALPVLAACERPEPPVYPLAAAETGGFFYEFAQLLTDAVAAAGLDFRLERRVTLGTLQNLQFLRDGTVPLALALSDATVDDPQGVVALGRVYENYLQCAVPADSPIRQLADLPGHRVSLGFPGSGTENSARRVLAAAGIDPATFSQDPVPLVDLLDALASGRIEAGFFAGGVPNPLVDPASGRGPTAGIRLLSLAGPLATLRAQYGSVYQPVLVPAGVYGATEEVETVGIASLVLATSQLPDQVADGIAEVLITRADELIPAAALGAQYLSPSSLIYTFGIPLHPGAAAAYRRHHG